MANIVQTNEGSGESELDEWLRQNRLYSQELRQKLMKQDVTLDDLAGLSSDPISELR